MFRSLACSAAVMILATSPALAELAPAQVWDNIVKYYEKFGYEVQAGNREEAGDSLTLTDVTFSMATAADVAGHVELKAPKISLSQTGSGDVRTVFDGDITGNFDFPEGDEDMPARMDLTLSMPGNEMISSGSEDAMTHKLNYPAMTMSTNLVGPDNAEMPIKLSASNITGSYSSVDGTPSRMDYDMAAETAHFSFGVAVPEGEGPESGNLKFEADVNALGFKGEYLLPEGSYDLGTQMAEALRAGMSMSGVATYGPVTGSFDFSGTDEEGNPNQGAGKFTGEGGNLEFAVSAEGIRYGGTNKAGSAEMTIAELPFPITYAAQSGSFDILIPLLKTDAAQPFSFAYSLGGLTLGDAVWGLFDPTGKLPRDPADLTIDIGGDLMVKRDLIDPEFDRRMMAASTAAEGSEGLTDEQMAELDALMAEAQPFDPKTVTIRQVALTAAGAEADISGDLIIPEGGQIDQPVGTLNGNFKGVNGLMDALVAMGLVPQDQVMGMRMMLMMFARPVEGETDSLTTTLEFKEGGSIFANGQQVK